MDDKIKAELIRLAKSGTPNSKKEFMKLATATKLTPDDLQALKDAAPAYAAGAVSAWTSQVPVAPATETLDMVFQASGLAGLAGTAALGSFVTRLKDGESIVIEGYVPTDQLVKSLQTKLGKNYRVAEVATGQVIISRDGSQLLGVYVVQAQVDDEIVIPKEFGPAIRTKTSVQIGAAEAQSLGESMSAVLDSTTDLLENIAQNPGNLLDNLKTTASQATNAIGDTMLQQKVADVVDELATTAEKVRRGVAARRQQIADAHAPCRACGTARQPTDLACTMCGTQLPQLPPR